MPQVDVHLMNVQGLVAVVLKDAVGERFVGGGTQGAA
jgi:hypothetical protein